MSRAVLSLLLFLSSWWGTEPHSIPLNEGLDNEFSSSSKYLDEDLAKLFDDILLQEFSSSPDKEEARTTGRMITRRAMNKTRLQSNSFNHSESASSSHKQEQHLAKIFDHIVEKKDKESFLFNRDASKLLSTGVSTETLPKGHNGTHPEHNRTLPRALISDVQAENMSCRQLFSFLQKNVIIAAVIAAVILVVTVLLVLMMIRYTRRKQPGHPPANMTYNIFLMNGKAWWQKSQESQQRKFAGKHQQLKSKSSV